MGKCLLTSEELELLNAIAAGTSDGAVLEEYYRPRLLWFARVMGVPWQDCFDLVQDVFLAAIREIRSGDFRQDSSLITWLDAILKHKIKDLWRSWNRYRRVFTSFEPGNEYDERRIREYAVSPPSRLDEALEVRGALRRMPTDLRVVLLLNEIEGLTLQEISLKLKKPSGTLGRKLAEARRIFQGQISASVVALLLVLLGPACTKRHATVDVPAPPAPTASQQAPSRYGQEPASPPGAQQKPQQIQPPCGRKMRLLALAGGAAMAASGGQQDTSTF